MATSTLGRIQSVQGRSVAEASRADHLPPVMILNMFHSGLGIARALSGTGVRVIGLSANPQACGNSTRFCEVRVAPDSQDAPQQLLKFLLRSATELEGAVIFPTRDADVLFLDRFRTELSMFCLAIPGTKSLRKTIDKYELTLAARHAGVPTPHTIEVCSAQELDRIAKEVSFPCVLKPVSAFQWHLGNAWQQVGARKAVRVDSEEGLRSEYEQISQVTPRILVQEWIPGPDEQIVVLGGYADANSELLSYFTARKLLQSPSGCGTGCIIQSESIPEIISISQSLLQSLRYQGIAEIEYKLDSASGQYKLIEINTRHWDQHQLGLASGVNLTWVAYSYLTGRSISASHGPIVTAKWVGEDTLLMYSLRALYHRQIRLRDLWRMLSGHKIYGVWAWDDPLPSLRFGFSVLLPELARAIFKSHHGVTPS